MTSLQIKLLIMPAIVAMVTFIGKKWGNTMGGIIASLPWVAGPIVFFITLERGTDFAVRTIPGVMVGIIGWFAFCVAYILVGQKLNALYSIILSYLVYFGVSIILQPTLPYLNVHAWFILCILLLFVGLIYFPKLRASLVSKPPKTLKFDLPLRMLMITAFVLGITYFAEILGPNWSGILTPFPVMTAVLAIFTHHTQGIAQVRKIFIGIFTGMFGFALFLYLVALLLPHLGLYKTFFIGVGIDIIIVMLTKKAFEKASII
jgi:hypothetical protein